MGKQPTKRQGSLASFLEPDVKEAASASKEKLERTRGTRKRTEISVRFPPEAWRQVHMLALDEGVSLQKLIEHALSDLFRAKGLEAPVFREGE